MDYFRALEEESIRDNFVLIYELFDEIMDHGYPQTTETKILQEFIKTESYKLNQPSIQNQSNITDTISSNKSWRQKGIHYKINQAFLDVVEKVNSIVKI